MKAEQITAVLNLKFTVNKVTYTLIGLALLVSTAVMLMLVNRGAALRSGPIISPTEIGADYKKIGMAVANRLFPDFQKSKHIVWVLHAKDPEFFEIVQLTHQNVKTLVKPEVKYIADVNYQVEDNLCPNGCWWVVETAQLKFLDKFREKDASLVSYIHIYSFNRNETVSEKCTQEKLLDQNCLRVTSVREVSRKIKTENPHFFMRAYLENKYYLYVEKF